jgi:hypothetical protein
MALIEKRPPTRGELRWFGLLCLGFFGLLGAISALRHGLHTAPIVLWFIGGAVALLYYAIPPIQQPFYLLWINAAYPIGWVMSHLMMAITFYGVLTPIGLIMRLFGRDPMNRTFDRAASTYWMPHDPSVSTERYFRQY